MIIADAHLTEDFFFLLKLTQVMVFWANGQALLLSIIVFKRCPSISLCFLSAIELETPNNSLHETLHFS